MDRRENERIEILKRVKDDMEDEIAASLTLLAMTENYRSHECRNDKRMHCKNGGEGRGLWGKRPRPWEGKTTF